MAVASTPGDGKGDGEREEGVGGHLPPIGGSERGVNILELGSETGVPAIVFTGFVGKRFLVASLISLAAAKGILVLLGVLLLQEAVSFSLDRFSMD